MLAGTNPVDARARHISWRDFACLAGLRTRLIDIRTDLGQLQIARRMTARSQNRFGALVVESTADNSRDYREDWQPQRCEIFT
jgi:hypothetical protein